MNFYQRYIEDRIPLLINFYYSELRYTKILHAHLQTESDDSKILLMSQKLGDAYIIDSYGVALNNFFENMKKTDIHQTLDYMVSHQLSHISLGHSDIKNPLIKWFTSLFYEELHASRDARQRLGIEKSYLRQFFSNKAHWI